MSRMSSGNVLVLILFGFLIHLPACTDDKAESKPPDTVTQEAIAAYQKSARKALEGSRKKMNSQTTAFLDAQLDENFKTVNDPDKSVVDRRQAVDKISGMALVVDPHRLVERVKESLEKDGDIDIQKQLIAILQGIGARATGAIPLLEDLARDKPTLAPYIKLAVDAIKADI